MVALASYLMQHGSSTFIRRWEAKKLSLGSTGKVKVSLTTTRLHDPGQRKVGQDYDDLQYAIVIEPLENSFSKECLDFLEAQRQGKKHPAIYLVDEKHHLLAVEPVPIELEPERKNGAVASYNGSGTASVYPDKVRTADDWVLEWQSQEPEE